LTKKLVVLFCLLVVSAANGQTNSGSAASTAIRYTVFLAGNKAGFETSSRDPDDSLQFYYEFNDRGRGPKITEHIVLDGQGIPTHLENTGIDYEKAPVDEQFSSTNGSVAWKNRAEQGAAVDLCQSVLREHLRRAGRRRAAGASIALCGWPASTLASRRSLDRKAW
jgi:hypothetical protein